VSEFAVVAGARYHRCADCRATFRDPNQWLTPEQERERYLLHRNDPADEGYRAYLSKCVAPLLAKLTPGSHGLDYGSGPGSAAAAMLREAGHRVASYDPHFRPDRDVLALAYDFVVCTETIEHFRRPAEEFERLDRLLRPGGWLALMTQFLPEDSEFAAWPYRRDPTHIVFYDEQTLRRVAERFGWACETPERGVALMRRRGA
jgi:cyclopropane fatty-acyl-phospholipid synthase-like methyltransferase